MALSEIKTNTPKQDTKDEPQANGSYKIRQLIIKQWDTHIYIYNHEQSQNSPTKIQYIDAANKGNKIYIYQLKTKLTKAQTGKQY